MIIVNNPFGLDPMDFDKDTAADRVGSRIREIRIARGLSQKELGERVGLNADRIQKYENGARKPKDNMLKSIATALDVNVFALIDPVTTSYLGAMFAMFEMEQTFNMKIEKRSSEDALGLCLAVEAGDPLYDYMEEWYNAKTQMLAELNIASTDAEREEILKSYRIWEWTFPQSIIDKTEKNLQKQRLKQKIEMLQEVYDKLDQDGGDN